MSLRGYGARSVALPIRSRLARARGLERRSCLPWPSVGCEDATCQISYRFAENYDGKHRQRGSLHSCECWLLLVLLYNEHGDRLGVVMSEVRTRPSFRPDWSMARCGGETATTPCFYTPWSQLLNLITPRSVRGSPHSSHFLPSILSFSYHHGAGLPWHRDEYVWLKETQRVDRQVSLHRIADDTIRYGRLTCAVKLTGWPA